MIDLNRLREIANTNLAADVAVVVVNANTLISLLNEMEQTAQKLREAQADNECWRIRLEEEQRK